MSILAQDPYSLLNELQKFGSKSPPPIHLWQPELTGDIDIRVDRAGDWFHEGARISRQRLVKLFSTILRKEKDGCHYLITPREKWRIQVEDAAFAAILMAVEGASERQVLRFTTNVGDVVTAGANHPISMHQQSSDGQPLPYVAIRDGLMAKLNRSVYYQLADLLVEAEDGDRLGVWSSGEFFQLMGQ